MHLFFFFNDTATTEIYTLSLHDALPIYRLTGRDAEGREDGERQERAYPRRRRQRLRQQLEGDGDRRDGVERSEEHTSELQSRQYLVCRLLLEKKKKKLRTDINYT